MAIIIKLAAFTGPGIVNPVPRVLLLSASGLTSNLCVREFRMKKATILLYGTILSLIGLGSPPVQAEVVLENNSELIGVWNLDGSAKDLDGPRRPGEQTWEFKKDGTLATAGYDERLPGGNYSVSSSYEVKDGKILADVVGRPGKKNSYTVIEMDSTSMILKQGIGEYMFFTKK